MVNPLDSKAPRSTVPLTMRGSPALVGGDAAGNEGDIARGMAGLPGSSAIVWVGPP